MNKDFFGINKTKEDFKNIKNSYLTPQISLTIKKMSMFQRGIRYRIREILGLINPINKLEHNIVNINIALYSSTDKFIKNLSSIENSLGISQPDDKTKTLKASHYEQALLNEKTRDIVKAFYLDITNELLKKVKRYIRYDGKSVKCKTLKKSEQNWILNTISLLQSKEFEKLKNHSDLDIKSIYDDTQNKIKDIENSVSDNMRHITDTKDPTGAFKDKKINVNTDINLNTIKNAVSNAKTKDKWLGHELALQMMEFPLDMIDAGKIGLRYGDKIEEFCSKLVDGISKGDLKFKDLTKSAFLEELKKTRSEDLDTMSQNDKRNFYKHIADIARSGDEKDENAKKEIDKFVNNNKEKLKKDIDNLITKNSINPKDAEEIKKLLSK